MDDEDVNRKAVIEKYNLPDGLPTVAIGDLLPNFNLTVEPFAALDEQTRMTMGHELLRIWSTTSKTVVFITHSLTEAVYLADEVYVMSSRPGRIIDRVEINLPRPRTYAMMATAEFGQLRERIWQQIRSDA